LLHLLALATLGGGIGLVFAPEFSWTLVRYGRTLSAYGVESGLLMLAGVVLFGLALVAGSFGRFAARAAEGTPRDSRTESRLDQVEERIVGLEGSVEGVSGDLGNLLRATGAISTSLQAIRQEVAASASHSSGHDQDSLFRLAASMDKLAAQVAERFGRLESGMAERLNAFGGFLEEVRGTFAPDPGSWNEEARGAADFGAPGGTRAFADFQGDGEEPAIEFFDTIEELEAMVGPEPHPTPGPPQPPGRPARPMHHLDRLVPDESVRRALEQRRREGR
jgi:hypothetical protein